MNHEQRRKRTTHFVSLCLCFLFRCSLPPVSRGQRRWDTGASLQEGSISVTKLSVEARRLARATPAARLGQSCLSTGSRWRNGVRSQFASSLFSGREYHLWEKITLILGASLIDFSAASETPSLGVKSRASRRCPRQRWPLSA